MGVRFDINGWWRLLVWGVALGLAGCGGDGPRPDAPLPAAARSTPVAPAGEQPSQVLDYDNNIYFSRQDSFIDERGKSTLARHVDKLKANPGLQIILVGHSDFQGSRTFDLAISEKRIDAVYDALRGAGILKKQVRRQPLGVEKANAKRCESEACNQAQRRVELQYGKIPVRGK